MEPRKRKRSDTDLTALSAVGDKWIPFPELADEDTLTACSAFEECYFETCLEHLKTAGGLRTVIEKLLHQEDSPPAACMFLYLRFSSCAEAVGDGKYKERTMNIAELAAESLEHYRLRLFPNFALYLSFLRELMQRVIAGGANDSDKSLLAVLSNYNSAYIDTLERVDLPDMAIELVHAIGLLCEELLLRSSTEANLIAIALQVLSILNLFFRPDEHEFKSSQPIEVLFDRVDLLVYPHRLHPKRTLRKTAHRYFLARLSDTGPPTFRATRLFEIIDQMDFARLTKENAAILAASGKVFKAFVYPDSVDTIVTRLCDVIDRLGDSSLKVALFLGIKKGFRHHIPSKTTLKRLVPLLISYSVLHDNRYTLVQIVTRHIAKRGASDFNLGILPRDLYDHVQTAINEANGCKRILQCHRQPSHDIHGVLNVRRSATKMLGLMITSSNPRAVNAWEVILPIIISGLEANPDWRQREVLVHFAGILACGLPNLHRDHVRSIKTVINLIIKALLEDPVDDVKETACTSVCRFIQTFEEEKIDRLMPLPLDDIVQAYVRYMYEAEYNLAWGAMSAIMDAVDVAPVTMAPYFDYILKRIDTIILNTKGNRLFVSIQVVNKILNVVEDNELYPPPHLIDQLLIDELDKWSQKDDPPSQMHAETLFICVAVYESASNRMEEHYTRLVPLCHRMAARIVTSFSRSIWKAICHLLASIMETNYPVQFEEHYRQLVLEGLKIKQTDDIYTAIFPFFSEGFAEAASFFQPILPECQNALFSQLSSCNDHIVVTALLALGTAFQVFDFTEEQISVFLTTVEKHRATQSNTGALMHALRLSLGYCALKHAAFMCDIDAQLLHSILAIPTILPLALVDEPPFIGGTCTFWEEALQTEKYQSAPSMPALQRAVASIQNRWPMEAAKLPRVVRIVQRMNDIIASHIGNYATS